MSGGDTIRASIEQRERLLTVIGDPVIPAYWRGRALGVYAQVADEPSDAAVSGARALVEAVEVFHRLWALRCRVEALVERARLAEDDFEWCASARALLDPFERGAS